jgi:hypothetical protein
LREQEHDSEHDPYAGGSLGGAGGGRLARIVRGVLHRWLLALGYQEVGERLVHGVGQAQVLVGARG